MDVKTVMVSPFRHLTLMVAALFVCETGVMLAIAPADAFNWSATLFDAGLVSMLAFGLGYVLMAAPLRRALLARSELEQQTATVFEHAPLGIVLAKPDGRIIRSNPAFLSMLGYRDGELRAARWQDLTHPEDIPVNRRVAEPVIHGERDGYALEKRYRRKDGDYLWASLTVSAVRRHDRSLRMMVAMIADISARKRADELQRLSTTVFQTSGQAMMITDGESRIQLVNPAFTRITGYAAEEAIGRTPRLLSSGRHDAAFYAEMWQALHLDGQWQGEVWNRHKDGTLFVENLSIAMLRGADGGVQNYVGVFGELTQLHRRFEDAFQRANFDALTNLPNRTLLWDRLTTGIAKMRRDSDGLAVLFIDLDGFKEVNDCHGHLVGDDLLRQVACRLQGCVRGSDTLARLGGDEFVVVLLNSGSPEAAAVIAEKMLAALADPFALPGAIATRVGASIGIARFPEDGEEPQSLLAAADGAMYDAKRAGKGMYRMAPAAYQAQAAS